MSRNAIARDLRSPKYRQRVVPAKSYWEERYGAARRALDEALCEEAEDAIDDEALVWIAERTRRGLTEVRGFDADRLKDARAWAGPGTVRQLWRGAK